ncbi:MAG TPA: nucleotidyltransferase family protein [Woeseiaceae bacterium]|nr:nucleotidyltransferase family protein [Woeseiaceae bacterium]
MAEKQIFAIVLAAGASSRFGSPKQLEECDGTPLVTRAVQLAENVCGSRTILVAGHEWRAVVHACRPLRGYFANNARYRSGMAASIACGVRCVAAAADAVLLLLADQPLVTRAHLDVLIAAWRDSPGNIVATRFAETAGPPVIFPRRYFTELCDLQGDAGARSILARAADRVRTVTFEDASVDIDRPEDLGRLP